MIGPAIKWHLEVNGCSNYKLAAAWGVTPPAITKLVKKDSNPTWSTIERVAKTLNISVADIVDRAIKIRNEENEASNS
jgi:transcriptional regulator with XRE-family HTH domain